MSFLKNKKCKRIIIVLLVCLLYTGAYLFGHYVVAPTRNTNSAVSVPDYNVREQLAEIEKTPLVDSPFGKSLAAGAAQSGDPCPVSFFLSDLQMIDPEETVSMLKSCNVSMISIPWSGTSWKKPKALLILRNMMSCWHHMWMLVSALFSCWTERPA